MYSKKPFPHIIYKNYLIKSLKNNVNEDFDYLMKNNYFENDDVYIQNKKRNNKQIIITNTDTWKKVIEKCKSFKELYKYFNSNKFFNDLLLKFKNDIIEYTNIKEEELIKENIKVNMDISICNNEYFCNIHNDRRDHLFSMLIYPGKKDESKLCLYKLKNDNNEYYDTFPEINTLNKVYELESSNNNSIIFLNTGKSYHEVPKINTKNKKYIRKYIYISFDFNKENKKIVKDNGCNNNTFWKKESRIFEEKRRYNFLN